MMPSTPVNHPPIHMDKKLFTTRWMRLKLLLLVSLALLVSVITLLPGNTYAAALHDNASPEHLQASLPDPGDSARPTESGFNTECALNINNDAGMQYACSQHLYRNINLKQVQDDYTVVVRQAFADANRIVIAYQVFMQQSNGMYIPVKDTLRPDPSGFGTEYSSDLGLQNEGVLTYDGAVKTNAYANYIVQSYRLPEKLQETDYLDLRMRTRISKMEYTFSATKGLINKGGPKSTSYTTIDFTIPYYPEKKTFTINQTATSDGAQMTVQTITASQTEATITVSYPPLDSNTSMVLELKTNDYTCPGNGAKQSTTHDHVTIKIACPVLASSSWKVQGKTDFQGPNDASAPPSAKYKWNLTIKTVW